MMNLINCLSSNKMQHKLDLSKSGRWWCDYLPHLDIFKRTLPQHPLPKGTCFTSGCLLQFCTPDGGYGKYPKHVVILQ
jgi:hypothetical protein